MDFFQRQDLARRKTKWLVVYFVLAVLGILLAVNLAVGLIFSGTQHHTRQRYGSDYRTQSFDPRVFGFATLGTLFVIFCGSTYKTLQLSSGGKAVAEMMGGRPIDAHTSDPDERKLLNVVEEMCIASGTPMPQVYVMDHEPGINAFAAGHSTKDMVVCATRGCLKLLTRDELQGVIGHEFSHILNGDMRLNLRLMGLVFGILCIAMFGRILMETRGSRYSDRDRDRDRGSLFVLGIALFIIGWIGVVFGKLIKSAVSRQREFLADAAAVQFTRNPAGLANALKKVGGCGSRIEDPNAEDASHLFFANGLEESFSDLFSTHPPLAQRIKLLDPSFDGKFTAVNIYDAEQIEELPQPSSELPPRIIRAPQLADLLGGRGAIAGVNVTAPALIISDTIGTSTSRHLDYAADLKSKLPEDLSAATRDTMSAVALVYAILLSHDETMRTKQLQQLQQKIDAAMYGETLRLVPSAMGLESRSKLPLVTMAMTALRNLSRSQYAQFSKAMQFLIESDEQIELFEYALQKMIRRQLEPNYLPPKKPMVQYYALKGLVPECEVLLSALAYAGHVEAGPIETAFHHGVNQLKLPQMNLLAASACGLKEVDAALEKLNQSATPLKKTILNACSETIAADGIIQEEEAELLRAIADSLDCPIPPLISLT